MKVELHLHTSRYSACAQGTPAEFMERLIGLGYEAVYITEHDAVWSEWEIEQLREGFPEIRIFPGVELSLVGESIQHLLVLGPTDPAYLSMRADPAEVLEKARSEGHLTVLAHPCRWPGAAAILEAGLLPDALEYHTGNHDACSAQTAKEVSERRRLPLVNSGDIHGLLGLERFWIETDRPLAGAGDIRPIVMNGAYVNCAGDKRT